MNTKQFTPLATMGLTNTLTLSIDFNTSGDAVRYRFSGDRPSRWCMIRYNLHGDPFFIARGRRYYLRDFMRVRI